MGARRQEGTNAMVVPPAALRPALATLALVETVALRRGRQVTNHVGVGPQGVAVRVRHVAVRHRGVAARRTMPQWAGAALWP